MNGIEISSLILAKNIVSKIDFFCFLFFFLISELNTIFLHFILNPYFSISFRYSIFNSDFLFSISVNILFI